MKAKVELRSIEGIRCAFAIKDLMTDGKAKRLYVSADNQEVYATDGFGVVIIPATVTVGDLPMRDFVIDLTGITKFPKGLKMVSMEFDIDPNLIEKRDATSSVAPLTGDKEGWFAQARVIHSIPIPNVRKVVPAEYHFLPASHPAGYNPLMAASILKHSDFAESKNGRCDPIKVNNSVAFVWELADDAKYVLMGLRGDADEERVFWQLVSERK